MKNSTELDSRAIDRFPGTSSIIEPARRPPIDISKLARVTLDSFSNLPDQQGIYFAIDAAGRVWYVGKAVSIRQRLATHNQLPSFKERGVIVIAWEVVYDAQKNDQRERELIDFFHPPLNDNLNFKRLPECDLGLTPEQEIERFLQLRIQMKLIELELEALKPNIVSHCEQSGGKLSSQLGTIRQQEYKSWEYSDDVELLKVRLSKKKKEEEQNGIATARIAISPVARLNPEALNEQIRIFISRTTDGEGLAIAEAV